MKESGKRGKGDIKKSAGSLLKSCFEEMKQIL